MAKRDKKESIVIEIEESAKGKRFHFSRYLNGKRSSTWRPAAQHEAIIWAVCMLQGYIPRVHLTPFELDDDLILCPVHGLVSAKDHQRHKIQPDPLQVRKSAQTRSKRGHQDPLPSQIRGRQNKSQRPASRPANGKLDQQP